ncbi:TfpX/TfpZ family type IV pilin accessory protein [Acinetobacter schindleri]|uniref:TfpX/TfpZ family type IV pilin accessory protein n=1 Tax=Acinetobacter schindleri TaxID=108981 RepID=UPI003CFE779E
MTINNRIRFFIGHFTLSIFIAFWALVLVFLFWYPSPLAQAVGVTYLFLMMLAIDVIVGPVLGFVVYKEGKKTLKMDLAIIILIQLSALIYGLYSIEKGRPAYITYNIDRFELVRKNEIASNDYQHNANLGSYPSYVAVQYPKDHKLREKVMFDEVFGGVSLSQRPEFYQALESAKQQMEDKVLSLNDLSKYNPPSQVDKIVSKYPTAIGFFPLKANNLDMTVLVDKEYKVIKIVDLRPWN